MATKPKKERRKARRWVVRVEVKKTPETLGLLRLLEIVGYAHRTVAHRHREAKEGYLAFEVPVVDGEPKDRGHRRAWLAVECMKTEGYLIQVKPDLASEDSPPWFRS